MQATLRQLIRWCSLAFSSTLIATAAAQEADALLHAPLVVLPVNGPPFQKLADVDGDGDLDAIGTRIHESGGNTEIVVWRNDQGVFTVAWQTSFALFGISHPVPRSFAVATADWNSDGRTDFVVAGGAGATRFLAQPGFTFQSVHHQLPPFAFPNSHAVAAGDFDGDTLPDLALVFLSNNTVNGELHVLLAAGGTLTTPITTTFSQTPLRLHALELDGVPGQEIMLSDRNSPTARVYAVGAASLQQVHTLNTGITFPGNAVWKWMGGDLDGDTDVDVVVFRAEYGSNGLPYYQIFRRTGPSTLIAEPLAIGGPAEYLADIDGDGDLDGICCGGGGPSYQWPTLDIASTFLISPNRGGGDFARAWAFPGAGSESMAGAADVDGDGDVDFVAGRCVFYGAGPWLEHPMPLAGGVNATIVKRPWNVRDLDRDGDPDFAPYKLNVGDGTFVAGSPDPLPPPGHNFGVPIYVDVDGDGAEDRVMRLYTYQPPLPAQIVGMALLQNNGGGHITNGGVVAPGLIIGAQFAATVDHYLGADCDGDGDGDIVYNDNANWTSQIFWNQAGTFVPGPVFGLLVGGRIDRVADFDGDGLPDLLMTGNLNGLHVRRGTGVPATPFQITWSAPGMPFEPGAVAIADVDDDGKLDFVRPNANGEAVLFVNNSPPSGGPTFAATTLVGPRIVIAPNTTEAHVRSTIAVADFDGDGRSDLALGHVLDEPNVGILLRRVGSSSPLTIADYQVVRQTFVDGYAADVDLDGDPDLMGVHTTRSRRYEGVAAGKRVQRHPGVAGEGGAVPVLGATGPFRSGCTEVLRLTGVPGPTLAFLGMSLGEVEVPGLPLPGLTLRLDPASLLIATWPINEDGQGRAAAMTTLPILLSPGLLGYVFYLQAFVFDPAAPQFFSQSNLMAKHVGL